MSTEEDTSALDDARRAAEREAETYRGGSDQPVAGYALTAGGYLVLAAVGLVAAKRTGRSAEVAAVGPWDLALMGLTTHKLSRMLAKDPVTSPLRVPFTRFQGVAGPAELEENVRGGSRKAIGELISCPFCLAQWVATGYAFGLVFAPRFTRGVGGVFSAVAVSDWLQLAYGRLQG